jgi:hypothetical protein
VTALLGQLAKTPVLLSHPLGAFGLTVLAEEAAGPAGERIRLREKMAVAAAATENEPWPAT